MRTVLVPVHIDTLYLTEPAKVVQANADFSNLPHVSEGRDINADVPNLGESVHAPPFQNVNLTLQPGVHLHWSLPDALTHGQHRASGTAFPAVPNRWMIVRDSQGDKRQVWIVESDYIYPPGQAFGAGVCIPAHPTPEQPLPYRYLGRAYTYEEWARQPDDGAYFTPLTAVGYGDPTFASLYANCMSVFGFYDSSPPPTPKQNNLQYTVIGWYADANNDLARSILSVVPQGKTWIDVLADEAGWAVDAPETAPGPERMLCYARVAFGADAPLPVPDSTTLEVSVGGSGTESLAAYLAHQIDPNNTSQVEDLLEAVVVAPELESRQVDLGDAFTSARHSKSFAAFHGGSVYVVRPTVATDGTTGQSQQVTLPDDIAHLLNQLNNAQRTLDTLDHQIETQREQVFFDWYKYMVAMYPPEEGDDALDYPDPEDVAYFMSVSTLSTLDDLLRQRISVEAALTSAHDTLQARLDGLADAYQLLETPALRHYLPNQPVVTLIGDDVQPTRRHAQDGRLRDDKQLTCDVADVTLPTKSGGDEIVNALATAIDPLLDAHPIALATWTAQPWNPILLEWRVMFEPLQRQTQGDSDTRLPYTPDFIAQHYALAADDDDLQPVGAQLNGTVSEYSGRAILTPFAHTTLREAVERFMVKRLLPAYYKAQKIPAADQSDDYLRQHADAVLAWYAQVTDAALTTPALANLVQAYDRFLRRDEFYALSQAFSGFNAALLQRHQAMQLDIADPLAFQEDRGLTETVRDLVIVRDDAQRVIGAYNRHGPMPQNDFQPIRAGVLRVDQLRLIDTFGQVRDVTLDNVSYAHALGAAYPNGGALVPARIVQPARLDFQFLSAKDGVVEINSHPATTPICGWLLPNYLDFSLMVFASDGRALGAIDQQARWRPPPGVEQPSVPDASLQHVIDYIIASGADFLSELLMYSEKALERIEPENFAQHQALALLMGRPLAVVRARLALSLRGMPALDQSWNAFDNDVLNPGKARINAAFTDVRFPVRLGEYARLNDGLVGYWIENAQGDIPQQSPLYAPEADADDFDVALAHIRSHADPSGLQLTAAGDATTLTLLIDPRGIVHATTGVLPVQTLQLPPDQFADALKRINVTFLHAPLLTPAAQLRLALPQESGFAWTWLARARDDWQAAPTISTIDKAALAAQYPNADADALWGDLTAKGWLVPQPEAPDQAAIAPHVTRMANRLGDPFVSLQNDIDTFLNRNSIDLPDLTATPSGVQLIREGWLRLSPNDTPPTPDEPEDS